jgi:glycosyltransferase involved in cell wall biosynthesis
LWRAFRDDPLIEFHLVAPEISEAHLRLHASGAGRGSLDLYRRVQQLGLEVTRQIGPRTLVHGNSTHSMGLFRRYAGPLLVQVNDYETALFPQRAGRIVGEHGVRRVLSLAWRHVQERRVLQRADLALCNSRYTAEVVARVYALAPDRLRVLHKAVETSDLERPPVLPPDPVGSRPHGARLVFLGSDWRRKGLDVLIDALPRVASRVPDVSLAVIGPDPADPGLQALLRAAGVRERVHLLGRRTRDEVAAVLWHSDVLVLPSRREALGVAVLEGMAAGLPVVASRAGGIPEILRTGVEGLLVEPEDAAGLAESLVRLLFTPDQRAAMGEAAKARARQFSAEAMTSALRQIYLSVGRRT